MKKLIETYTFNAASKQITLSSYVTITLDRLLLITNVTDNIIIYNFADSTTGATISGNVITLNYNTTTMSNTDTLQIFYDVAEESPATDEGLDLLSEQVILLRRLLKTTDSLAVVDVNQRLRVDLDGYLGATLTATGLSTRILDSAGSTIYTLNGNTLALFNAVPELWKMIDSARIAYNTGIRSQLAFT